jgi:hypothetical protein
MQQATLQPAARNSFREYRLDGNGRGARRSPADAGQADIIAALSPKTKLKFRWRPFGTGSGKAQRVGFGYIESWEESAPTSGLVAINLSIKGTGALDMTPQP